MFAREKKQYRINVVKTCYMTKPFRHKKFKILKRLKGLKKSIYRKSGTPDPKVGPRTRDS